MKTFLTRFEAFLKHTGLTAYKLAQELDTSESVLSSIRAGKTRPSFDFLDKILRKYEVIDINWLITGKGHMLKTAQKSANTPSVNEPNTRYGVNKAAIPPAQNDVYVTDFVTPTVTPTRNSGKNNGKKAALNSAPEKGRFNLGMPMVITVNERKEENIIYVPVKARAGYLSGYGYPEFITTLPSYRIPGLDNATYRMFEVDGPSMAPNIINGDRVIGQWVDDFDNIRENRVHIVVTRSGVVVKRLLNRIKERGKIVIKSDTVTHRKEYPTSEIDIEDVLEIWYGRMKLSADFSEPVELYHRINDLEADMHEQKVITRALLDKMQVLNEPIKSAPPKPKK
ncbi:MAG: LexA family transcriptional regulator [Taibaiella sp.]|nr:LexA family transcriptional regulator [Taibaiella sp.]